MNTRTCLLCAAALLPLGVLACVAAGQRHKSYVETFDRGPGGWYADRRYALPVWDGVAYCASPWWLDANHAPPGAGYLHLLMWMYTDKRRYNTGDAYDKSLPYHGNRFAEEGYSRNLTNARVTVRLRGEMDLKGTQIMFLVQTQTAKTTANMLLTGQPFKITREWSEQSIVLRPDPSQWTCLGARHDMQAEYGCDDIATVLSDVNLDIIFVLFPVKPVPANSSIKREEIHLLRALEDYPVLHQELPKGIIMIDSVRIDYP